MASLSADCNTIATCSTISGTNRKKLKNTIDCHGVKNITVALPEDIMMLIISKLDLVGFHCFSAVCRSWQAMAIAAKKIRLLHLRPQLPWLMLSSLEDHHPGFFSLSHAKVFRLELPEAYGARSFGSNWGWLIMVGKMGRNFLLNPFTRVVIELPPQATLPVQLPSYMLYVQTDNLIKKAMLLSPPAAVTNNNSNLDDKNNVPSMATDDCVVIAIYCIHDLAFCRPGDEKWTALGKSFRDIIFYDGRLYAITEQCDLKFVELGPHPKVTSCNIARPAEEDLCLPTNMGKSFNLVECLGELLMVMKCYLRDSLSTVLLKIFKLDPKGQKWTKVKELGDQMLFIGTSTALSVSARDYPGFRGNCIYFTEADNLPVLEAIVGGRTVVGLFHLEDNSIEHFFSKPISPVSPPIWFAPIF
ncbi:F-box protein At2g26160-like [Telopea speciosissima]|uniref:F-box protein At2g26160-like n=1 Tax=Telopea speciosissima TaxID=54955 RepID=UPI001CC537A9|nr:F-box protein At2g26160-like [Telopea speciosissima]